MEARKRCWSTGFAGAVIAANAALAGCASIDFGGEHPLA